MTHALLRRRPPDIAAAAVTRAREAGALVVCSDFDGTLAPIVATSDLARPLPAAVAALEWLTRAGAAAASPSVRVAIVTSRDTDDLARHLTVGPEALVIGCAGLERRRDGAAELDPEAERWLPALDEAARRLHGALDGGPLAGARIERKRCGVVLHTRGVHGEGIEGRAGELARAVADALGLRLVHGKRSYELRPPVDRDKATALDAVVAQAPPGAGVIAAGDDVPDVPMLRAAATMPGGIAVAVTDEETADIVVDAATDVVDGPWGWAEVLHHVVAALRPR